MLIIDITPVAQGFYYKCCSLTHVITHDAVYYHWEKILQQYTKFVALSRIPVCVYSLFHPFSESPAFLLELHIISHPPLLLLGVNIKGCCQFAWTFLPIYLSAPYISECKNKTSKNVSSLCISLKCRLVGESFFFFFLRKKYLKSLLQLAWPT